MVWYQRCGDYPIMDLKHSLETEDGIYEVYLSVSQDDLDYLQRLSLMFLIDKDMFPFRLLSAKDTCNFHNAPEMLQ